MRRISIISKTTEWFSELQGKMISKNYNTIQ